MCNINATAAGSEFPRCDRVCLSGCDRVGVSTDSNTLFCRLPLRSYLYMHAIIYENLKGHTG
jgi:hypothetical protein